MINKLMNHLWYCDKQIFVAATEKARLLILSLVLGTRRCWKWMKFVPPDESVRRPHPACGWGDGRHAGAGEGGHVHPERLLRSSRQRHMPQPRPAPPRPQRQARGRAVDVTSGGRVHARADAPVREPAVLLHDLPRAWRLPPVPRAHWLDCPLAAILSG